MSSEAAAAILDKALGRLVAVVGDYSPMNQDAVDSAISEAIGAMEAALAVLRPEPTDVTCSESDLGEVPDA